MGNCTSDSDYSKNVINGNNTREKEINLYTKNYNSNMRNVHDKYDRTGKAIAGDMQKSKYYDFNDVPDITMRNLHNICDRTGIAIYSDKFKSTSYNPNDVLDWNMRNIHKKPEILLSPTDYFMNISHNPNDVPDWNMRNIHEKSEILLSPTDYFMKFIYNNIIINSSPITLYHQTSQSAANAIISSQKMVCGTTGLAGGGIYFALSADDTNHKAKHKGVILQADVYLGNSKKIQSNGEQINVLELYQSGYASILIPRNGSEYVVYNSLQVKNIKLYQENTTYQPIKKSSKKSSKKSKKRSKKSSKKRSRKRSR